MRWLNEYGTKTVVVPIFFGPHFFRPIKYHVPRCCSCLRLLAYMTFAILSMKCGTMIWDSDAFQTGKVNDRGRVTLGMTAIYGAPNAVSVEYGLGAGWEARSYLGWLATFSAYRNWDRIEPVFGLSLGAQKTVLASSPFFLSAGGEMAGFANVTSFLRPDSLFMRGGRLSAGVAGGVYPFKWLGLYTDLKAVAVLASYGNLLACGMPAAGLSFEPGGLVIRVSANSPQTLLSKSADAGRPTLEVFPTVGIQCGYRW